MAIHAFEMDVRVPIKQFVTAAAALKNDPLQKRYHDYYSVVPSFQTGGRGFRIAELALVYAADDTFAGVLHVSDDPTTDRNYAEMLKNAGLTEKQALEVPSYSFTSHLVAGRRIDMDSNYFRTMNVVRSNLPKKGNKRAETMFSKLVFPGRYDEMKIQPKHVFDLGYLVLYG